MDTWHDLIKAWGGPKKFAHSIGVTVHAAQQMSSRNNVHSVHWGTVVARAPRAGLKGITFELLASLKRGREAKSPARFRRDRVELQAAV